MTMEIKFTVSLLLLLLTPWTSLLQTQAETPQVNNAWRCNSISDSKKNHLCRKNRAANLWCRDFSKCQYGSPSLETRTYAHPTTGRLMEVMHCSDEDVARRVGMTCNNFPFYNGGYPVLSKGIDWDDEWEQYECTEINLHGNVCMSWSSKEQSRTEYEIGYSNCTQIAETAAGYHYCQTWKTRQRETKKCDSRSHGCSPNCLEPTYCFKKCCRDSKCYDCSYTPYMELEHAEAECTKVNYKGACLEWKQEEYDEHNIDFREYEVYKCLELSANEQYCRRWVGETDSEEEFEIATCECLDEDAWIQSSSASFCHRWTCYETGYDYYFPNMIWTMLPVSVCGVFVACCGLCIRDGKIEGASAVGVLYIICALCLTMVAATLAGIASVIIATGMIFVIFPMALLLFWWNRKLQGQSKWFMKGKSNEDSSVSVTAVLSTVSSSSKGAASFNRDSTISTHVSNHAAAEENDALEPEDVSMHDMMIPVVQAEPLPIFDDQIPIIGPRNQLSRYVESSYYRHVRSTFFLPHQFAD